MNFTTPIFLFVYLPLVLGGYFILPERWRNTFLFVASSVFYFYGEQEMLLLMYLIIFVNYGTALLLNRLDGIGRKVTLCSCVLFCIGFLWYFKYWNFTVSIFSDLCALLNIPYSATVDKIILPLGISFYTFHCLSYTLDVYARRMMPDTNLLHFATYVLMFPQLVAGPIVRYIDIQPQLMCRQITLEGFANGIRRFCFGLGKKVLIANIVGKLADQVFALPYVQLDILTAWIGAMSYTLQIYFDFSGYSDMAIGLAALFGFRYKENFNHPYVSKSVGEFWRRWHISLSTWLRDYVYIHMGGNRVGRLHYCFNILVVFLLSGLWHGANFTFVLWGLWYGLFICFESLGFNQVIQKHKFLAHVYALLVIVFGWVLFRADNVYAGFRYWQAMLGLNGAVFLGADLLKNDVLTALFLGAFFSCDWAEISGKNLVNNWWFKLGDYASYYVGIIVFLLSVAGIAASAHNPFIYFRF